MFVERICVVCTSNMWYACAVSSDTSFGSITECLFIFFSCLFFLFRFHLLIRIHIITSLWFSFGAFMFIYFFLCISSLKVVLHCLDTDYDLFVYFFWEGECIVLFCFAISCWLVIYLRTMLCMMSLTYTFYSLQMKTMVLTDRGISRSNGHPYAFFVFHQFVAYFTNTPQECKSELFFIWILKPRVGQSDRWSPVLICYKDSYLSLSEIQVFPR